MSENSKHRSCKYKTVVSPVEGIGKKRQWIMEHARALGYKTVIMIDDDVFGWFIRKSPKAFNLRKATIDEIETNIFQRMRDLTDEYPMVGVSPRSGNNRFFPNTQVECARQWVIHAINVRQFFKLGIRFDRLQCMEDFDVVLQFLTKGYPNVLLTDVAWDTKSGEKGGCSIFRTNEVQTKAAEGLHKLYPDFVKVVSKTSKSAWDNMKTRTDVIVQWKKSYARGRTIRYGRESLTKMFR